MTHSLEQDQLPRLGETRRGQAIEVDNLGYDGMFMRAARISWLRIAETGEVDG